MLSRKRGPKVTLSGLLSSRYLTVLSVRVLLLAFVCKAILLLEKARCMGDFPACLAIRVICPIVLMRLVAAKDVIVLARSGSRAWHPGNLLLRR